MKIFETYWGTLAARVSPNKFECLPRLTLVSVPHMTEINFGFLWFQIWLTLWDKEMQEFNKSY